MTRTKPAQLFFGLLLFIFLIGAAFVLGKSTNTTSILPSTQSQTSGTSQPQGGGDFESSQQEKLANEGSILYLVLGTGNANIYSLTSNGETKKKVFTDQDEELKIRTARGLTINNEILALLAPEKQEFIGSLYLLSTDGKGTKQKLLDNFASPQPALLSPNGKFLAYVLFSNAEKDFGFSLLVANPNGTNKRQISRDSSGLTLLAWSPDSQRLAYSKNSSANQVYTIKYDGTEEKQILDFKEQIYQLSWQETMILFVKGPSNELNKAELFRAEENGHNVQRLTNNEFWESSPVLSPNKKLVAYLSIAYDKSLTADRTGDLYLLDLADLKTKKLVEGVNWILGWKGN